MSEEKKIYSFAREGRGDAISDAINQMLQDGKEPGVTPVYIIDEVENEVLLMCYEPFTVAEWEAQE